MCGIVGIGSRRVIEDFSWLSAASGSLAHRGPDEKGLWVSENRTAAFAHRRLAIIDLSSAGHQPMVDQTGDLCIAFNGEIYNHPELRVELEHAGYQFQSHSDTEVLIAAYREWGSGCAERLNGMFAFAIYDKRAQSIFMARDRAGEKPLFYRIHDGRLVFASELKALMCDPEFTARLDPLAFECYLSFGYVPGDQCILQGVNKLPPAHALTFHLKKNLCRVYRYWNLPSTPEPGDCASDEELVCELERLLEASVRRQLVADVPVGVLLSGGIDSSLTTAMAARSSSKVKTFTVCFPGHGSFDETRHARLIARHFGTEHVELQAERSTVEFMPLLARQFDEPMVDSSMIPTYLVSRLVRQHCTVALGGDGGDELFGGYGHYNRLLWLQRQLGWIPRSVRMLVSNAATVVLPLGFKGRNWLQALGTDYGGGLPLIATYFDLPSRRHLMAGKFGASGGEERVRRDRIPEESCLLQRATRMDFQNYLPEDILVKVDRASMLNSLEVRAPWLDHNIIEFAYGKVPSSLKATRSAKKILLKRMVKRVLPPEFDVHRKQGFSIPLASWLREKEWSEFFRQVLVGSQTSLFAKDYVSKLFVGQARGYSNSERLFALVMFELWRREYKIAL